MKTLILYATKHGATKKISESIAEKIPGAVIRDINAGSLPTLSDYDCVVLGSPLTAGQINKEVKEFAVKNASTLEKMRLGLFVSGLNGEQEASYLANFPQALLVSAKAKRFLGGIYDPAKCGFFERTIMKIVAKLSAYTSTIENDKVDLFVKELLN